MNLFTVVGLKNAKITAIPGTRNEWTLTVSGNNAECDCGDNELHFKET